MAGGFLFWRGTGTAAAAYVMQGHNGREYYSEGGTALGGGIRTLQDGQLVKPMLIADEASYARWVDGLDPVTGEQQGRAFVDTEFKKSPKFMEHVITVSKELSVLAALDDGFGAVLDRAIDQAADDVDIYASQAACTRTRRGGQLAQETDVTVQTTRWRHLTSRADDPHRHVHWQISTKVQDRHGKWLALDTADMLKHLPGITAAHQLSIASNSELREWLVTHGYAVTIDAKGDLRVPELTYLVDPFSTRRDQIALSREEGNAADLRARWQAANPGREPSQSLLNHWDFIAWDDQRPKKAHDGKSYEVLLGEWREGARELGFQPRSVGVVRRGRGVQAIDVDADALADKVVTLLGSQRSTWSQADVEAVTQLSVMRANVVGDVGQRRELVANVGARALALCDSVLDLEQYQPPTTARHLTSEYVRRQDERLDMAFMRLASVNPRAVDDTAIVGACRRAGLDAGQTLAAQRIASMSGFEVIIGPAGAGKTKMAGVLSDRLVEQGRELRVLSPSKKGAAELAKGAHVDRGDSVAKLLDAYGFRWNDQGERSRLAVGDADPATGRVYRGPHAADVISASTVLLVDETGMLGWDDAVDLTELAIASSAKLVLMGDPRQLGAIGRGGVLRVGAGWNSGGVHLVEVHRFLRQEIDSDGVVREVPDEEYSEFSLRLREGLDPAALVGEITARNNLVVNATDEEVVAAITDRWVGVDKDGGNLAVTVGTNAQARQLNEAIRASRVESGAVDATRETRGRDNVTIGRGDVVVTRDNDRDVGVQNRDSWTVLQVHRDGSLTVSNGSRMAPPHLPASYVHDNVELGYAVTGYGQQGVTATHSATWIDGRSDADLAYVGPTRGQFANTIYVAAVDGDHQAGEQVVADALGRSRGDQGLWRAKEDAEAEGAREDWKRIPKVEDRQTLAEWRDTIAGWEKYLATSLAKVAPPLPEITDERRAALLAQAQSDDLRVAQQAQRALAHAERVAADNAHLAATRERIEAPAHDGIARANESNRWRATASDEQVRLADDETERLRRLAPAREVPAWESPGHGIEIGY